MKHVIHNEIFYTNVDALEHDNASSIFGYVFNVVKTIYSSIHKTLSPLLNRVTNGFGTRNLYKDVYADYLFYKEHCNSSMSYRIWCRYGSILLDVDRSKYCNAQSHSNQTQKTECVAKTDPVAFMPNEGC